MKTPREILLANHLRSVDQLDEIRNRLVSGLPSPNPPIRANRETAGFWRELFRLNPKFSFGLGMAWACILALRFSTHEGAAASGSVTRLAPDRSPALPQQRLLLAELVGLPVPKESRPWEPVPARPRSARPTTTPAV